MVTDQGAISQGITQAAVEAAKAAVQAMIVAVSEVISGARNKLTSAGPKIADPH